MESEDTKRAKGILFVNAVDFLKQEKGEEAVAELEKETGPLIFDAHRMYPLDDLLKLQRAVLVAAAGSESAEGYHKLGVFTFQAFMRTLVGATLTNVVHSPKEILEQIQQLWDTVLSFGSRRLVEIDETARTARLEISDDPRTPAYLQGVIEAGLASVGATATTTVSGDEGGTYSIAIAW